MQYDKQHVPVSVQQFNKYAVYTAFLRYCFDNYFNTVPLNYHYNESTCYTAKSSFSIQYLGQYHSIERNWTWAFLLANYNASFYAYAAELRQRATQWNDDFFIRRRALPVDDKLLFWLYNVSASYSVSPLYLFNKVHDGNYLDVLVVQDANLLENLLQHYHQHLGNSTKHMLNIWQYISTHSALLYDPIASLEYMSQAVGIDYIKHDDQFIMIFPDGKLHFPYSETTIGTPVATTGVHDTVVLADTAVGSA